MFSLFFFHMDHTKFLNVYLHYTFLHWKFKWNKGRKLYIGKFLCILKEEMRDVEKEPININITLKVCSMIAAEANEEANRRAKGHARENIKRVIFGKFNEMKQYLSLFSKWHPIIYRKNV